MLQFGTIDEPKHVAEHGVRFRMFNCFDCHSEYGFERRMTVSDNSFLE